MLPPFLAARIEEAQAPIGERIKGENLGAFEGIARAASQPKILFVISTAISARQDVLKFQFPRQQVLWR